ncbi:phosphoribosyltransferase family protein [Actinomadura barringtoniae]|uniref:Phosphoribosyltransferase family protein n=1 Tax=Actinomadura barringtoniae TaxID=1427535 RepID=A0A939P6H8_9ACTN|nr:phosphoribosyltransferase family protein [Actinomadura barringtoniae]MBO2446427.1 phosphoribosyltransferase family protein [Actinomadura barringtoniae]
MSEDTRRPGEEAARWPGEWVAERLGVRLEDGARPVGAGLSDLVGLAVRRNPKRAHLLVSTVLGKHVPTDPRLVYGSGLLLGDLVRVALLGGTVDHGGLLSEALKGRPGAAAGLRDLFRAPRAPVDAAVLGYAETATALGHAVADSLGGAYYLHSTRRAVPGFATYGGFEEEHSHATSHLMLPGDPGELDRDVPLVLVDDELSTGRTVLNTIEELHAVRPRRHYVVAALVDLRSGADEARMDALARRLNTRIDAVALARGTVRLPGGVLEAGQKLVAGLHAEDRRGRGAFEVERVDIGWPEGLPDGGRHGFTPEHRVRLEEELPRMAARLPVLGRRVLVLGFEELMYAPLRLAEALADAHPDVAVRYSTTTRSPVLAVDDPGYAIRSRLSFPALDEGDGGGDGGGGDGGGGGGGGGERYAYNVDQSFDSIVLVVDDVAVQDGGLLARLRELAPVTVATIPAYRGQGERT